MSKNTEFTPVVNNFKNPSKADKLRSKLVAIAENAICTTDIEEELAVGRKMFKNKVKVYDDQIEVLTMQYKKNIEPLHKQKEKLMCEAMEKEIEILEGRNKKKIIT